jgi:AcrR family transcriptional regulator
MTVTPWGDASRLRSLKLTPGPGKGRWAVRQSQRERLFAATVAVVADKGYEATRVEDVLVLAGVSRNAFYKHFSNKRDCFVATLEAINGFVVPAIVDTFEQTPGPWDRKLAAILDLLATAIVAQPAMARVAWVEVYSGGPAAIAVAEQLDNKIEDIVCRALKDSPERAGLPREIVRALVVGVRKIVQTRVRQDRAGELADLMPGLFDWLQSYRTPPDPLCRPQSVPSELVEPSSVPPDARERVVASVIDLVAEKGYLEMSMTDIATRASVSLTTLYTHFDGKEAAYLAALNDVQKRVFAAILPHFTSADDWASAVAVSSRAFFAFLATHPTVASFGGVGTLGTSDAGLELRAEGVGVFEALLDEGFRQYPDTNPVSAEAIGAAVDALLFTSIRHKGVERVYEIAPTACYITLAPFVGAERACELSNLPPLAIGKTTL